MKFLKNNFTVWIEMVEQNIKSIKPLFLEFHSSKEI